MNVPTLSPSCYDWIRLIIPVLLCWCSPIGCQPLRPPEEATRFDASVANAPFSKRSSSLPLRAPRRIRNKLAWEALSGAVRADRVRGRRTWPRSHAYPGWQDRKRPCSAGRRALISDDSGMILSILLIRPMRGPELRVETPHSNPASVCSGRTIRQA